MAKGALRPRSGFHGKFEHFSMVDISLSRRENREMDTATEAWVRKDYREIRNDPVGYAHSCLFVEWLLFSVTGSEPSHPMFHLIGSVLDSFAKGPPFWPVQCSGMEKVLRLSGFAMELDRCVRCGKESPRNPAWSPGDGGIVCGGCSGDGDGEVPAGILAFLKKTGKAPVEAARRISLWKGGFKHCFRVLEEFAEIHLEKRKTFKSLSVLEDLEDDR